MSNELAKLDVPQLMQLGSVFAKSGFFADAKQEAQAVVKILAGAEMGFSPIASMMGVYVIQGRVSVGANLMAAAVKKSGKYDYRVLQMDETACEIEYYQGGQSIGKSKFTIADAKKAQTKNLDKYARNMLFARAMSNGVRWYCPDALGGTPVYTPEEMGADTDEEGNVIGGVVEVAPMSSLPMPDPQPAAVPQEPMIQSSTFDKMEKLGIDYYGSRTEWEAHQAKVAYYWSNKQAESIRDMTEAEALNAIARLEEKVKEKAAAAEAVE